MAESQYQTAESTGDELFDRYTLPKVALTIILVASLVGTYLTLTLSGTESLLIVLAKWLYLVALGVLVGGLCWKHAFVRPGDLDEGTSIYCERMYARFDRIAWLAVVGLGIGGRFVVYRYWQLSSEAIYRWSRRNTTVFRPWIRAVTPSNNPPATPLLDIPQYLKNSNS